VKHRIAATPQSAVCWLCCSPCRHNDRDDLGIAVFADRIADDGGVARRGSPGGCPATAPSPAMMAAPQVIAGIAGRPRGIAPTLR
jgi:hypothetical protein